MPFIEAPHLSDIGKPSGSLNEKKKKTAWVKKSMPGSHKVSH